MQPPGKLWMLLVGGDETRAAFGGAVEYTQSGGGQCVGDLKALKAMKNLNG